MQPNIGSPQYFRNTNSFSFQQGFQSQIPQSKGFPGSSNRFYPQNHEEHIAPPVKSTDNKFNMVESARQKKLLTVEGNHTMLKNTNYNESRFKPNFPLKNNLKAEQQLNETVLRSSFSNIVRKFDCSTNLRSSLRNTTNFNLTNKLGIGVNNEVKKLSGDYDHLKPSSNTKHNQLEVPSHVPFNHFKMNILQRNTTSNITSKTPTKFFGDKKLDDSSKYGSKTLINSKRSVENANKNVGITKNIQTQDKKVFKSLNQIVEIKAKQKNALQTSRAVIKHSKVVHGYELGKMLGKGKFGEVFLARHHQTGFFVALKKILKIKVVEHKMIEQFCNQIKLHSCLDHPNIVRFYGCFQEKQDVYLALQYIDGGTLFDYLNETNYLNVKQAVQYLRDIIQALTYMHDKSIAHRDIKPENIVITSQGVAKLCDFGWSAVVQSSRKTYCGTFDYAPPEILQRKNYDMSVDIWCIGILTFQLLTGKVPFEGQQRKIVMQKIVNVDKTKIDYPVDIPQEAKDFIEALVQKDPNMRPKSQDLLKFKLFSLYPSKSNKPSASKKIHKQL